MLTPNIPEAEAILEEIHGRKYKIDSIEEMVSASEEILKLGPKYVLIKGGHLKVKL